MGCSRFMAVLSAAGFLLIGCASQEAGLLRRHTDSHIRVAFCNVIGMEADLRESVLREIAARGARTAFLFGRPRESQTAGWRCMAIDPNGRAEEWPGVPSSAGLWSCDLGPLHVALLERMAAGGVLYDSLLEDLSSTPKRWKLVLMPKAIFGADVDRALLRLAELFERQRVELAVSGGTEGYLRTVPIGSWTTCSPRYVVLGLYGRPAAEVETTPCWWAYPQDRNAGAVLFCILDATPNRLKWSAYDTSGRLTDLVVIPQNRGEAGGPRSLTVSEILAKERDTRESLP